MKSTPAICPNCETRFRATTNHSDLDHENIADWILKSSLSDVLKLQTVLAQQGIALTIQTAEILHME